VIIRGKELLRGWNLMEGIFDFLCDLVEFVLLGVNRPSQSVGKLFEQEAEKEYIIVPDVHF
jgi:hypothetical protein